MNRPQRRHTLVLSCEHGGNDVPPAYRRLFRGARRVLDTHRGLDIGALHAARYLQKRLRAPLVYATVTRLVADLNRSVGHPRLHSEFTRHLSLTERRELLAVYYDPYRARIRDEIARRLADGQSVLHLSVHSFTPVLHGEPRNAELGLLYDPARRCERDFCVAWQRRLAGLLPGLRIRRNYPYHGASDGLQRALRRRFPTPRYVAVELELNHAMADKSWEFPRALLAAIAESLAPITTGH
jgi:predicted N-formylglutamate amidohydrolase